MWSIFIFFGASLVRTHECGLRKRPFYPATSQIAWVHVTLFQWTWAWHELQCNFTTIACTHAILRSWINVKFIIITYNHFNWVSIFFLFSLFLRRAQTQQKNSHFLLLLLSLWLLCESHTNRRHTGTENICKKIINFKQFKRRERERLNRCRHTASDDD